MMKRTRHEEVYDLVARWCRGPAWERQPSKEQLVSDLGLTSGDKRRLSQTLNRVLGVNVRGVRKGRTCYLLPARWKMQSLFVEGQYPTTLISPRKRRALLDAHGTELIRATR